MKYIDPDGRKIVFAQGSSSKFQQSFIKAAKHLVDNGRSENLMKLLLTNKTVEIKELEKGRGPRFSTEDGKNTIHWGPTTGAETPNLITISPTTVLDHEMDHAQQNIHSPKQQALDVSSSDSRYRNKEERRVITGSEQKTARALGEINENEVTRTNHGGRLIETKGPTTNHRKFEILITPKD